MNSGIHEKQITKKKKARISYVEAERKRNNAYKSGTNLIGNVSERVSLPPYLNIPNKSEF